MFSSNGSGFALIRLACGPLLVWLPTTVFPDGLWAEAGAKTVVWDLKKDWSDLHNPNGDWTYADQAHNPITQRVDDYLSDDLGPEQPAWANASGSVPGWAKSNGASPHDFPEGSVMSHGPARILFTVPGNGVYTISGGGWMLRHIGREVTWKIWLNHQLLTQGPQTDSSPYGSDDLEPWSKGAGGPGVLTQTLHAGDVLAFGHDDPDFFAYDITITATGGSDLTKTDPSSKPRFISFRGKLALPINLCTAEGVEIPRGEFTVRIQSETGERYLQFRQDNKLVASIENDPPDRSEPDSVTYRIPLIGTVYLSQDDPDGKVTRESTWKSLTRPWSAALRAYRGSMNEGKVRFHFQQAGDGNHNDSSVFSLYSRPWPQENQ